MAFDSLIRNAQNAINSNLGTGQTSSSEAYGLQELPWNELDQSEAFFGPQDIDPSRWNKMFPYRLLVIDIRRPDRIYGGGNTTGQLRTKTSKSGRGSEFEYVLTQEIANGSWELNLPITPQQLSIQDQYSINTSATSRGIVEEHSGVRFKMISAGGTTGVWAQRPSVGATPISPSSLGTIFAGTLSQFGGVLNDLKRVGRSFSGSHPASITNAVEPIDSSATTFSTGYYQAMLFGQFLERYAQLKKNPRNKHLRLVFDIPKQNQAFIVTPLNFSLEQNAQKPLEYMWKVQFKAWKRIKLDAPPAASQELPSLDSNIFQRIDGTLREVRRTLGNATNLLKAVRSDFQRPFNILRQTALVVKDTAGFVTTAADLPRQIYEDAKSAIEDSLLTVDTAFNGRDNSLNSSLESAGVSISAGSITASNPFKQKNNEREGLSREAVENGALGADAAQREETSSTNNLFSEPEPFFDIFDSVEVDQINLTREQQQTIEDDLEEIRLLTVDDFKTFKEEMKSLALDISNQYGAGDETYSNIYNRPTPKSRVTPMSLEENEVLLALYEAIQAYDLLTATLAWNDLSVSNPLDFAAGLANEAGIDFDVDRSKTLVPVPFGLTIEEIAARYLRDTDKWVEIAQLNKLTSPYIDEEGFRYSFLSNASGRQFNVDDTEENIFIGQKVFLGSDTVPSFSRKIVDIERIGDGNYLVTVDGVSDLDKLATADNAYIQGYQPGTVNSQNQIYIPVDSPSQQDDRIQTPNFTDSEITKISKIDWLLTDDGDVALNQLGDIRLAWGLTNLIQALKIKIRVQKGTLLRHLDFGLGLKHGISIADIEQGDIFYELNRVVLDDPRFSGIDRLDIRISGTTLAIDMAVKVANGTGVVPITFEL